MTSTATIPQPLLWQRETSTAGTTYAAKAETGNYRIEREPIDPREWRVAYQGQIISRWCSSLKRAKAAAEQHQINLAVEAIKREETR